MFITASTKRRQYWMIGFAVPASEICGLHFTEAKRRLRSIDHHGNEHALVAAHARFFTHPLRLGGVFAPQHDQRFALGELALDVVGPRRARRDFIVPEHVQASGFEALGDLLSARGVLAPVRQKYVGHFPSSQARLSSRRWRGVSNAAIRGL
jgi:hypothetical protein